MKRQTAKIQALKGKIATLINLVKLGIKKYIFQLLELEDCLEAEQKNQMMTLEKAQEIYGDPEAIKRGYINQDVINFAYKLAKEIKSLGLVLSGIGNAHPYWMSKSKVYAQMDKEVENTRQFSAICTISEFLVN